MVGWENEQERHREEGREGGTEKTGVSEPAEDGGIRCLVLRVAVCQNSPGAKFMLLILRFGIMRGELNHCSPSVDADFFFFSENQGGVKCGNFHAA